MVRWRIEIRWPASRRRSSLPFSLSPLCLCMWCVYVVGGRRLGEGGGDMEVGNLHTQTHTHTGVKRRKKNRNSPESGSVDVLTSLTLQPFVFLCVHVRCCIVVVCERARSRMLHGVYMCCVCVSVRVSVTGHLIRHPSGRLN